MSSTLQSYCIEAYKFVINFYPLENLDFRFNINRVTQNNLLRNILLVANWPIENACCLSYMNILYFSRPLKFDVLRHYCVKNKKGM